jgi:hypothetical protein
MAEKNNRMATTTMPIIAPELRGISILCCKMIKNAGSKPGVKG